MSNNQIAKEESKGCLHVSHVNAPNHSRNRNKSNAGKGRSNHPESNEHPIRFSVSDEETVVVTAFSGSVSYPK